MKDLSSLADGSLTFGSMAASNTVTSTPKLSGPGGVSEQTAGVKQGAPSLDMQPSKPVGTDPSRKPAGYTPAATTWKTVTDG